MARTTRIAEFQGVISTTTDNTFLMPQFSGPHANSQYRGNSDWISVYGTNDGLYGSNETGYTGMRFTFMDPNGTRGLIHEVASTVWNHRYMLSCWDNLAGFAVNYGSNIAYWTHPYDPSQPGIVDPGAPNVTTVPFAVKRPNDPDGFWSSDYSNSNVMYRLAGSSIASPKLGYHLKRSYYNWNTNHYGMEVAFAVIENGSASFVNGFKVTDIVDSSTNEPLTVGGSDANYTFMPDANDWVNSKNVLIRWNPTAYDPNGPYDQEEFEITLSEPEDDALLNRGFVEDSADANINPTRDGWCVGVSDWSSGPDQLVGAFYFNQDMTQYWRVEIPETIPVWDGWYFKTPDGKHWFGGQEGTLQRVVMASEGSTPVTPRQRPFLFL